MADIKMRHSGAESSDHQISVREELRAEYEANGWVEVGEAKTSNK